MEVDACQTSLEHTFCSLTSSLSFSNGPLVDNRLGNMTTSDAFATPFQALSLLPFQGHPGDSFKAGALLERTDR